MMGQSHLRPAWGRRATRTLCNLKNDSRAPSFANKRPAASSIVTTTPTLTVPAPKQVVKTLNSWTALLHSTVLDTTQQKPKSLKSPSPAALHQDPQSSWDEWSPLPQQATRAYSVWLQGSFWWVSMDGLQHSTILILIICPNIEPWVPFTALEMWSPQLCCSSSRKS